MNDWPYWLALRKATGLGPRRIGTLIETYGSPENVFGRSAAEIARIMRVPATVASGVLRRLPGPMEERECEAIIDSGCRLITLLSDEYPPLLKTIYDFPPFLYARGKRLDEMEHPGPRDGRMPWIAIVGSRKATPHGRSIARRISNDLCASGCVVVSGMAAGIDSYAHRGAIDAARATVAVLGAGIDVAYPRENSRLLDEVCQLGGALSEYGMGEGPEPWHFPMRNRIISGMCEATVVVEAGETSGALITADLALEQGREVMAVPGPAGAPMSKGTNGLIKAGAALVESAGDVLEALGFERDGRSGGEADARGDGGARDGAEAAVLALLNNGACTIDEICDKTTLAASTIVPLLMNLELRGLVERMGGAVYCRRR